MSRAATHWMKFYVSDYIADTMHLSTVEHGAYFLLICHYWQTQKPLMDDDKKFCLITKLSTKQWKKIKDNLATFFQIDEHGWSHRRLTDEIKRASFAFEERQKKGQNAAQKRWNKKAKPLKNNDSAMLGASVENTTGIEKNMLAAFKNDAETETDTERIKNYNKKDFIKFWDFYPIKIGKANALKAFKKALTKTDAKNLLAGVAEYKQNKKPDIAFCNPATWLNQERWLDEWDSKTILGNAVQNESFEWEMRLRHYKPDGYWKSDWGERPCSKKCQAPTHLLDEWRDKWGKNVDGQNAGKNL